MKASFKICIITSIMLIMTFRISIAQDRYADSIEFNNWPNLEKPRISPNGHYATYYITNSPLGLNTLVVKSLKTKWKIEIVCKILDHNIVLNDKQVIFMTNDDSLGVASLNGTIRFYGGVKSFKVSDDNPNLVVILNKRNELSILNEKKSIENVSNYFFVLAGKSLIFHSIDTLKEKRIESIKILNLETKILKTLWVGRKASYIKLNKDINKIAFIAQSNPNGSCCNEIGYCDLEKDTGFFLIKNPYHDSLQVSSIESFNRNNNILIKLTETANYQYQSNPIDLKIWSYNDQKIQSEQIEEIGPKSFFASVSVKEKRIIKLEVGNDVWNRLSVPIQNWGDTVLIFQNAGNCSFMEANWNPACKRKWLLVNINSGKRMEIPQLTTEYAGEECFLSPNGKYVSYYDISKKAYYCYNLKQRSLVNITENINLTSCIDSSLITQYQSIIPRGIAGWSKGDKYIFIYDANDIWTIDPMGIMAPKNLTKGYGRKNNIIFSFLGAKNYFSSSATENIILSAFNVVNKENGFFQTSINSAKSPQQLTMGAFIYYLPFSSVSTFNGFQPIKAKNRNIYLLQRESSKDFPNFFYTNDFKDFKAISHIYPEKRGEWITTQLIRWRLPDGKIAQGVLYKPENFDSTKKYPVLFNVYEMMSNSLNAFIRPSPLCNGCVINPSLFARKGYLVFKPDIYFNYNRPGESALHSVQSAIDHLAQYSWIDTARVGLQGCSFGGFETNYIISHSNKFKAACTVSGMSDFLSFASNSCKTVYSSFTLSQFRINKMIWDDPRVIIENSPISRVNNILSPLLLVHTINDKGTPFNQALQMYLILRRLGRKVWLLEYDDAEHGLSRSDQSEDLSLRMLQFFDHYLKDKPAPKWMKNGVKPQVNIDSKSDIYSN